MADDWDLHAVVRGCTAASSRSVDVFPPPSFQPLDYGHYPFFPDPFEPKSSDIIEELEDLYKPFVPKLQPLSPQNSPISPFSVLVGLQDFSPQPQPQPRQKHQPKPSVCGSKAIAGTSTAATGHSPSPRSKRRKNQLKRVCQVPAGGLSSDMWSWRKYGQKPIKGSPYPRGYYRCSTSKGCLARKQVERNRSDPGMFIVTYTAEHNHPMPTHRNSLAGSTRQKPATPQTVTSSDTNKPSCSSPVSAASLSPATEKTENRDEMEDLLEDEDDELGVSDMVVGDDFFEGLEVLTGLVTGEPFPDHLPTSLPFPWLTSNATTTAAGGG